MASSNAAICENSEDINNLATEIFLPTAQRIETNGAEIFYIENILSEEECVHVITLMHDRLRDSTATDEGVSEFRISRTCELRVVPPGSLCLIWNLHLRQVALCSGTTKTQREN